MRLTEKQKQEFQAKVEKINDKDVEVVKSKIDKEIDKLKSKNQKSSSLKLEDLIANAELLNNILKEEDFPISDTAKKWMIFGLKYLVSDIDLIPDDIPLIGYKDDTLLLSWIKGILESEIDRFNKYNFLKKEAKFQSIFKEFKIIGAEKPSEMLIILPGLSFDNFESDNVLRKIVNKVREVEKFLKSDVYLLDWDFSHLNELKKTFKMIDHQLKLKPVFDDDYFQLEWNQSKLEAELIGGIILNQLSEFADGDNITIVAFDINGDSIIKTLKSAPKNISVDFYLIGSTLSNNPTIFDNSSRNTQIFNVFSRNDNALKFLNDYCDIQFKFCGLSQIQAIGDLKITNKDLSEKIDSHFEYRYLTEEIISGEEI